MVVDPFLFFLDIVLTYMSTQIACTTHIVKHYYIIRMPTRFSVFRRFNHEFSTTYAIKEAKICLLLSNVGLTFHRKKHNLFFFLYDIQYRSVPILEEMHHSIDLEVIL